MAKSSMGKGRKGQKKVVISSSSTSAAKDTPISSGPKGNPEVSVGEKEGSMGQNL